MSSLFGKIVDPLGGFARENVAKKDYKRLQKLINAANTPAHYMQILNGLRNQFGADYNKFLTPALSGELSRQIAARGGVATPLAGAVGASPELMALSSASHYGDALQGIQSDIALAASGVPKPTNTGSAILGGAVQGFVSTGSPLGAAAGAVAGGLNAKSANSGVSKSANKFRGAFNAASPESFGATANEVLPTVREAALASGVGQLRAQSLESAITASGLRGTGLGTLASIASAAQPELEGLNRAFEEALRLTQGTVSNMIGQKVSQPNDPVARALEGLATATATGLFNRKTTDYSNISAPQGTSYAGPGDLNTLGQ